MKDTLVEKRIRAIVREELGKDRAVRHGVPWTHKEEVELSNELDVFLDMQAIIHRRSKTAMFLRLSKIMDDRLEEPDDSMENWPT